MPQLNRVNTQEALKLRLEKNLTYKEIGKLQGVDQAAVHRKLKPLLPGKEVETFKTFRADILAGLQIKLLSVINPEKLKKLSVRDAIVSAGILYDKERLERGLATENVDIHGLNQSLQELQDAEKRLLAEIAGRKPVSLGDIVDEGTKTDVEDAPGTPNKASSIVYDLGKNSVPEGKTTICSGEAKHDRKM